MSSNVQLVVYYMLIVLKLAKVLVERCRQGYGPVANIDRSSMVALIEQRCVYERYLCDLQLFLRILHEKLCETFGEIMIAGPLPSISLQLIVGRAFRSVLASRLNACASHARLLLSPLGDESSYSVGFKALPPPPHTRARFFASPLLQCC
ncbi:hypothetical protein T08_2313 [Trichinella sp. T8]|nr:hypothetical protein T08_2313 [Trichinella sp. T8]